MSSSHSGDCDLEWYSKELNRMNATQWLSQLDFPDKGEPQPDTSTLVNTSPPLAQTRQSQSTTIITLPQMIDYSLDPFVPVAGDVNPRQRSLIQFYVRDAATILFGVSGNALYSPTAATGIPCVGDSETAISWICILADEMIHALNGRERSHALIRRRTDANRRLKAAILRRDDDFQEAMMGVAISGLVQYAFGDEYSQSLHATIANMLIHEKANMEEALRCAPNLEPFYFAAQFAFGRTRIGSIMEFEEIRSSWINDIKGIFWGNSSIYPINASPEHAPGEHTVGSSISTEYIASRAAIIEIVKLSMAMLYKPSSFAKAMQFALMNELSWTILLFKDRIDLAVRFFRRLKFICQHSILESNTTAQQHELRSAAVATMLSRARRDILGEFCPYGLSASDAEITQRHITALKMFYHLRSDGQNLLLAKLLCWLEYDDVDPHSIVSIEDIIALEVQVTESWHRLNRLNT